MAASAGVNNLLQQNPVQFDFESLQRERPSLALAIEPYIREPQPETHVALTALHRKFRERHVSILIARELTDPGIMPNGEESELSNLSATLRDIQAVVARIPPNEERLQLNYAEFIRHQIQILNSLTQSQRGARPRPVEQSLNMVPEADAFELIPDELLSPVTAFLNSSELAITSAVNRVWCRTSQSRSSQIYVDYMRGLQEMECQIFKERGPVVASVVTEFYKLMESSDSIAMCKRHRERIKLHTVDTLHVPVTVTGCVIVDVIERFSFAKECPDRLKVDLRDCLETVLRRHQIISEDWQRWRGQGRSGKALDPNFEAQHTIALITERTGQRRFGEALGLAKQLDKTIRDEMRIKVLRDFVPVDAKYVWGTAKGSYLMRTHPKEMRQIALAIPESQAQLRASALSECSAVGEEQKDNH